MMKAKIIVAILGLFIFAACKKTELVLVEGNTPPHYQGVTTLQVQNFVTKAFIDLTGREPDLLERDEWTSTLKSNDLDASARSAFIAFLQLEDGYTDQFNNTYLAPKLGGNYDSLALDQGINQLSYFRQLAVANGDSTLSQYWGYEIQKMTLLRAASWAYHNGQISINEYLRRAAHNYAYDQINMGTENFVIACFENFLKRLPTEEEEIAAEAMVDGQSARVFLQDGNSKGDFLTIMVNSNGFYEGLVIDTYLQLLVRLPNSVEMGTATISMKNGDMTIQDLQRSIMISAPYVGF